MYILFFSGVNNIPDGFIGNWKEAKFNKIDSFLAVPQTLCPVYVSQIDGFCDLLGGNLAHYTDS